MSRVLSFIFMIVLLTGASALCAQSKKTFSEKDLALPGKRGACLTLREPGRSKQGGTWKETLPRLKKIQPYWHYSWGADFIEEQKIFIKSEFVPMIWAGRSPQTVAKTLSTKVIPQIKNKRVRRLLGFNEPDGIKQANMTVELALELWPQLEALGIPLCSPSAVHADREWMTRFMDGVKTKGYRVDYIGVHSNGGSNAEAFKKSLQRIHERYGRPLLVTEFAVADWKTGGNPERNSHSPAKVLAFAKEVLPWMEAQAWVSGYRLFSFKMSAPRATPAPSMTRTAT